MFSQPKLTTLGSDLHAQALSGKQLTFASIRLGSGILNDPSSIKDLTHLIQEQVSLSCSADKIQDNIVYLYSSFLNDKIKQPFKWTEIGLFAQDPTTQAEILYAYAYNSPSDAETINPAFGDVEEKIISIPVSIQGCKDVTWDLNDSFVFATKAEFNNVEANISTIKTDINTIKTDINTINQNIHDTDAKLNQHITTSETEFNTINQHISDSEKKINTLDTKVNSLKLGTIITRNNSELKTWNMNTQGITNSEIALNANIAQNKIEDLERKIKTLDGNGELIYSGFINTQVYKWDYANKALRTNIFQVQYPIHWKKEINPNEVDAVFVNDHKLYALSTGYYKDDPVSHVGLIEYATSSHPPYTSKHYCAVFTESSYIDISFGTLIITKIAYVLASDVSDADTLKMLNYEYGDTMTSVSRTPVEIKIVKKANVNSNLS